MQALSRLMGSIIIYNFFLNNCITKASVIFKLPSIVSMLVGSFLQMNFISGIPSEIGKIRNDNSAV